MARGVTLIEVLVAVGVIGVLLGILAPALGGARAAAHSAACRSMQKALYTGAMDFSLGNSGKLAGINTTGKRYLGNGASLIEGEMLWNQDSITPTQTFDWISPSMGWSAGLHGNRAMRTKQIFEDLGCAATRAVNHTLYGWAADKESDFEPLLRSKHGIGQISYLSPGAFHLMGPGYNPTKWKRWGWRGPAIPPAKYRPNIAKIGARPETKIFIADGTRYLAAPGKLDFDVDPTPKFYGSFTTSGPIYAASTAYGQNPHRSEHRSRGERSPRKSTYPFNRELSYRHSGKINVTRFDGSATSMTERESKTDAAPWYPTGSEFTGVRATEGSKAHHEEGEILG